jgi:hypothetical protein
MTRAMHVNRLPKRKAEEMKEEKSRSMRYFMLYATNSGTDRSLEAMAEYLSRSSRFNSIQNPSTSIV